MFTNKIQVDTKQKAVGTSNGTFYVGDKVRYTDEILDMTNKAVSSTRTKNTDKINNYYKMIWQKRFLTILGFEKNNNEIALVGYKDKLIGQMDTYVCNLSNVQLVTEAEKLLYDD